MWFILDFIVTETSQLDRKMAGKNQNSLNCVNKMANTCGRKVSWKIDGKIPVC